MQIEARLTEADKTEIAQAVAAIVLAALAIPSEPDVLLTEQRAAAELNVADHNLRDARKRGEIQFFKIGKFVRYSREQLDAYKQRCNGGKK